jgi:hypothetical protein
VRAPPTAPPPPARLGLPFTRALGPLTADLPSLAGEWREIQARDTRIALGPGDLPSPELHCALPIPGSR